MTRAGFFKVIFGAIGLAMLPVQKIPEREEWTDPNPFRWEKGQDIDEVMDAWEARAGLSAGLAARIHRLEEIRDSDTFGDSPEVQRYCRLKLGELAAAGGEQ